MARPVSATRPAVPARADAPGQPVAPGRPAASAHPGSAASARRPSAERAARPWLTPTRLFFAVAALVTYLGWRLPTERYITPETGFGYALGIVGGSAMLLLFLYSARKRVSWLAFLGSVTKWFEAHMVLGVVAPICVLYHANFSLGATNSNVALFCMLTVAGSGFVGRYIYSRIHFGLYGRKMSLGELRAGADRLRQNSSTISFLPELVDRLEMEEKRLLVDEPQLPVLSLARPLVVSVEVWGAHWRLRRYVRKALRRAARGSATIATQRRRLKRAAYTYIGNRLAATRRVAAFTAYERMFSLWHVLHLPIIFMLLIAGVVHVVAVHVY